MGVARPWWRWTPLAVVLVAAAAVQPWLRSQYRPLGWPDMLNAVAFVPLAAVAGGLLGRRSRSSMGPLLATLAVLFGVAVAADAAVRLDVSRGGTDTEGWRVTLYGLAMTPAVTVAMTFGTLLLPDGRLPSRRWRPLAWAAGASIAVYMLGILGGLPGTVADALGLLGWVAVLVCAVLSLGAVVWRCVRGRPAERAGLAVVLGVGALPTAAVLLLTSVGLEDSEATALPWFVGLGLLLPGSVLVAALISEPQSRPPVARRLVLAALTIGGVIAGVALAVAVGVAVAHTTLGPAAGLAVGALTLLALAWPGRLARVGAIRLLYGRRDEPLALLRGAARHVAAVDDPATALRRLLAEVRTGLRVSGVAVEALDGTVVAADGALVAPIGAVALVDGDGPCGRLVVGARSLGEELTAADHDLLAALAPHVAALAAGTLLVQHLRGSRTRIVLAREEERRRLRRELHDGLGAALSGIGYGIDAVALTGRPPAPAQLATLRDQLSGVQRELRSIIDNLRPPALDSSGLAAAVRSDAGARATAGTTIDVVAADLGELPAAVELAVYRVVQEALSNALRHAGAAHIQVRLHRDVSCLTVIVQDDGVGLPPRPGTGVGLRSMSERVAELGGRWRITATEPGTRVVATFPLLPSQPDGAARPVQPGGGQT